MDLFIHTLTGTVFELRVSPFETIQSIKSKVQRLEGISMSQQHLIWRSMELEDGYCLHDYGIKSGATLTLVLAMRGGPINMRRVSLEEPSLQEMAEYMDENRDELWDKIMNDNKQVTLLVYREGDQLNFFRVYDGSPGTLSPYSDSISATSYNGHDDETTPANKEKEAENLITKDKMRYLRQQITSKSTKKLSNMQQPPRPSSKVLPSANLSKRRIQFGKQSKRDIVTPCYVTQNSDSNSNHSVQFENTPSPIKLDKVPTELKVKGVTRNSFPAINRKGETTKDSGNTEVITPNEDDVSGTLPSNLSDRSAATNSPNVKNSTTLPGLHNNSGSLLRTAVEGNSIHKPSRTKGRSLKPLGAVDKSVSNKFLQQMIKKYSPAPPAGSDKNESNGGSLPRAKKCSSGNSARTKETSGALPRAKESNGATLPRLQPSVYSTENYLDSQLDETLKHSQLPDIIRDPVEYENYKNLLNWVYPKGKEDGENVSMKNFKPSIEKENNVYSRPLSKTRRKVAEGRPSSRVRSSKHFAQGNLPHLPPVHGDHRNLPTLTGKKKQRCSICTKKLGLATTYQCRCGSKFCAKHRYPEAHTCTYDYKAEGRRLLERSNPVVTAPKLPKI